MKCLLLIFAFIGVAVAQDTRPLAVFLGIGTFRNVLQDSNKVKGSR